MWLLQQKFTIMFPIITHSKMIGKSVTVFQMKGLDMYFLQITLVLK